jgi:hypothetical protein
VLFGFIGWLSLNFSIGALINPEIITGSLGIAVEDTQI